MDALSRLYDIRTQLQAALDPENEYTAEMFVRTVRQVVQQLDSAIPNNFVPNYAPVLILPKKRKWFVRQGLRATDGPETVVRKYVEEDFVGGF